MLKFLLASIVSLLAVSSAQAVIIFTLSPAGDGGIVLTADGMASQPTQVFGTDFTFLFDADDLFGPSGTNLVSATQSGSIDLGGMVGNVIAARLHTTPAYAAISFSLDTEVIGGSVTVQNIMATWPVGTLPFSSLTPGSYSGLLGGTSILVTPETTPLALLGVGAVACLADRRRRWH